MNNVPKTNDEIIHIEGSSSQMSAVICERNDLLRRGFQAQLSPRFRTIGAAGEGKTAFELITKLQPQFLLLNSDLEDMYGLEVCTQARKLLPKLKILVVTDLNTATDFYNRLVRAGASGLCLASSGPIVLTEAIDNLLNNKWYCDIRITNLIDQQPEIRQAICFNQELLSVALRLSLRDKQIADELGVEVAAIERHVQVLQRQLKAQTRTRAMLIVESLGYTSLPVLPKYDPVTGLDEERIQALRHAEDALRKHHEDFDET